MSENSQVAYIQEPVAGGVQGAPASERFLFLDAMRGLAALSIAVFHFYQGPLEDALQPHIHPIFHRMLVDYRPGAEVFFVLSGFLIAYIMGKRPQGVPGSVNFILRRLVRLTPAYWLTIAFAIGFMGLSAKFLRGEGFATPGLWEIAANLMYAQDVTGYGQLLPPLWALCIEIQFYIFATVFFAVLVRLPDERMQYMITLPLAAISLCTLPGGPLEVSEAWLWRFWFMFYLGIIACWQWQGRIGTVSFWIQLMLIGLVCIGSGNFDAINACLAGLLIYMIAHAGMLSTALSHGVFQYFGRISYSFYLLSPLAGKKVVVFMDRITDSPAMLLLAYVFAFGTTILAAELMFRLVEAPSTRWSRRLKAKLATKNP